MRPNETDPPGAGFLLRERLRCSNEPKVSVEFELAGNSMAKYEFGYREGSGAQILSDAVDATWRTVEEIAELAGHPRGAPREHLEHMLAKGFVEKDKVDNRVRYRLAAAYRLSNRPPKASD